MPERKVKTTITLYENGDSWEKEFEIAITTGDADITKSGSIERSVGDVARSITAELLKNLD